jgi:hypothetical protein
MLLYTCMGCACLLNSYDMYCYIFVISIYVLMLLFCSIVVSTPHYKKIIQNGTDFTGPIVVDRFSLSSCCQQQTPGGIPMAYLRECLT